MILFLYGSDTFRLRQKLRDIIERYRKIHKSGLNLKILDLREKNFEDFKNEFQSVSMFGEKKLIILKNTRSNQSFKELFLKKIKDFISSKEIIIFCEDEEIPKDKFFDELKRESKFQEFKPLEGFRLKSWIKEEFKKYGVEIEERAIEKLVEFIGKDLWQLKNEIEKLISYKKKGEIKVNDVEGLVSQNVETHIFQTIDAIASKNKSKSLKMIKKHLEKGEKIPLLFSLIKLQFRNLLLIKDLLDKNITYFHLKKLANLHPFVIEKCFALSKKFQLKELKEIYQRIFELDLAIKNGKIEPETALILFISQI